MSFNDHKFLIVGLGSIGQRHARNLKHLGANSITAARTGLGMRPVPPDLETVKMKSLDEALADDPDVALVCNPTSFHVETARKLVDSGLDVLVEKPLSHDWTGVGDLLSSAETRNRILGVAFPLRFHPHVQTLRAWLEQGRLGELRYLRASVGQFPPSWMPTNDYRKSYAVRADLGGGCIRTLIHEIDLLIYLSGMPNTVTSLAGHFSTLVSDAEDIAEIILGYSSFVGSIHIDYVQKSTLKSRYLQIVGEEAAAWLDFSQHLLQLQNKQGLLEEIQLEGFDTNQMHLDVLSTFLNSVESRNPPEADGHAGARSLQFALAALESSATGRRVNFD